MPATSVPTVEDALVERLTARLGASVLVQLGLPAEAVTELERVYLVGVENLTRAVIAQQELYRETYTVPLIVEVQSFGTERAAARDRAWEIVLAIGAEISDAPRVDGAADEVELASIPEVNLLPTADGWIARALVHLSVTAIL